MPRYFSLSLSLLELVSSRSMNAGTEISSRSRARSEARSCTDSELTPRKSTRSASARRCFFFLPFFLPFVSLSL